MIGPHPKPTRSDNLREEKNMLFLWGIVWVFGVILFIAAGMWPVSLVLTAIYAAIWWASSR